MPSKYKQNTPLLSWTLLIIISLIWGTSFILIKKGLVIFDPGQVASIRILSAGLFLVPFAYARLNRLKRQHILKLLSIGFAGSLIPAYLFATAQTRIDSSIAGILNALTPLWVIIIGSSLFRQPLNLRTSVGMFIGFTGTALLVLSGSAGIEKVNYYSLFVVAATVCYGFNLNLVKFKLPDLDAVTITSVSLVMVSPFALYYLFFNTDFSNRISMESDVILAFGALILLGVVGTAVALIMFNNLVQLTDPVFTSSVTYLIPIVAIMWGIMDGEQLVTLQFAGMGLILVGVFIANRSKQATG
jgi:drug/metabolite transporter (DMT)-like permease